jgi:signal peptidase II
VINKKLRNYSFLIISIFIFLLDFFSKYFLINLYDLGSKGRVYITSFLDFILVLNPGISFGILSNGNDIQRWTLSFLSILVIFYLYYWSTKSPSRIIKISLFVMIGGALGNVFDRLIYGEVIDFISLHVFDYYWYVFNIADIAIVLGGLTILIDLTRDSFVKK